MNKPGAQWRTLSFWLIFVSTAFGVAEVVDLLPSDKGTLYKVIQGIRMMLYIYGYSRTNAQLIDAKTTVNELSTSHVEEWEPASGSKDSSGKFRTMIGLEDKKS